MSCKTPGRITKFVIVFSPHFVFPYALFSMLTTAFQAEVYPMPTCFYSLHRGTPDGPLIRFAAVGESVYHRWECVERSEFGSTCYNISTRKHMVILQMNFMTCTECWCTAVMLMIARGTSSIFSTSRGESHRSRSGELFYLA